MSDEWFGNKLFVTGKAVLFGCYFLAIAHAPPWFVAVFMSQNNYSSYFRPVGGILALLFFVIACLILLEMIAAWAFWRIVKGL